MNRNVQKWLIRILGHEGGYVNDPNDPGGETKWGISKRSYPNLDIASLTIEDAVEIYLRDFLRPLKFDRLPDGIAFQLFDFAVNSGVKNAIMHIQDALGLKEDGIIGLQTITKMNQLSESDAIMLILSARIKYLIGLRTWDKFSKGWMNRIAANLLYGAQDSD